jgi:hypothetical protein
MIDVRRCMLYERIMAYMFNSSSCSWKKTFSLDNVLIIPQKAGKNSGEKIASKDICAE